MCSETDYASVGMWEVLPEATSGHPKSEETGFTGKTVHLDQLEETLLSIPPCTCEGHDEVGRSFVRRYARQYENFSCR